MQDDVTLFARALFGRLGQTAHSYALNRAEQLRECGDVEGYHVWREVAGVVTGLSSSGSPGTRSGAAVPQSLQFG